MEFILFVAIAVLLVVLYIVSKRLFFYREMYLSEKSKKASVVIKHGKTMEHLIPWIKKFPDNPRKFRFIGDPIDGVLFADDKIVFMEFKSGKSKLSAIQKKIKELVENKRIEWKEIRI